MPSKANESNSRVAAKNPDRGELTDTSYLLTVDKMNTQNSIGLTVVLVTSLMFGAESEA